MRLPRPTSTRQVAIYMYPAANHPMRPHLLAEEVVDVWGQAHHVPAGLPVAGGPQEQQAAQRRGDGQVAAWEEKGWWGEVHSRYTRHGGRPGAIMWMHEHDA